MSKNAICNFVGQDTDWLAFWGAYLGAVFTLLLGLYSIYKDNQKQICLMQREAKIHALQIEIEKLNLQRVEFINYVRKDLQLVDSLRVTNMIFALKMHLRTKDATLILLEQYQSEYFDRNSRCALLNGVDPLILEYNKQFLNCTKKLLEELDKIFGVLQKSGHIKNVLEEVEKTGYVNVFKLQKQLLEESASTTIGKFTKKISVKEKELKCMQSINL